MNCAERNALAPIAEEVLDKLEAVAASARAWLQDPSGPSADTLVPGSVSEAALRNLGQVNQQNRTAYQRLSNEPVVSRVVAEDETGSLHTRFFCRADQGMAERGVISYLTKWGRLASMPVGDEYMTPEGQSWIVVSKTGLRPQETGGQWDAYSVVQREDLPSVTIESLRALLLAERTTHSAQDLLDEILAAEAKNATFEEGIRRSVITRMGLRDQPILDKFQDEIFRLPLSHQVVLLGPPGTGKTTTLIRRLGQKLDIQFLDEDEQRVVQEVAVAQGLSHERSWLMFTPTELLKQYLKEAFNRELVPASEQNLRTWDDHRRDLCRQTFGILKTATGGGTFVQKTGLASLQDATIKNQVDWFTDFDVWQRRVYLQELTSAVQTLEPSNIKQAGKLGKTLEKILGEHQNWPATLSSLAAELAGVQSFVAELRDETDQRLRAALVAQLQKNRNFVTEFAAFLETLQQVEVDETDDTEPDEEEEVQAPKVGAQAATNEYYQSLRVLSRSAATKRAVSKSNRTGKIFEWLGDRTLDQSDLIDIGDKLVLQTAARRFVTPVRRYIDGIGKRYRAFRRERQSAGTWYQLGGFDQRDVHPLELDVILLATLKAGNELINRQTILRAIDSPQWAPLKTVMGCYRHQILVDEATDFSPLQLACMNALAHPRTRSVFACGDFNQRLTTWGVRTPEALSWSLPGLEVREITVAYRQSRQLNDLARDIIRAVDGTMQNVSLPAEVDNDVESPVLLENSSQLETVKWLASRIAEIERFVEQLPSIAVFVNSEADVEPTAKALETLLGEHNIPVTACTEGKIVGQESSVRVFDIQHIKGLEFEAVFFLGVDRLAELNPELFDKYIYVGTTRAAAYLGLTCEATLPAQLAPVRHHFATDWTHKIRPSGAA
ncbi:ATP-binding domain-containing protein [Variovorax fucosicus]|uniref:ATP-binding domain-containing protein n=1 Tax=Variovorax fucosicus TaxID=3053517 RepID=UPI002576E0AD|nr:ATP-binding domain-containing protein [Variovorax sp. J22G47]MDM0055605.1 ATP-binding domain-containing protein [Variovorax sp. J22G47]